MLKHLNTLLFSFLLFQANAQMPKLMLPIGHTSEITKVLKTYNNKELITISSDGDAKRWEINSGKLLESTEGVTDIAIDKNSGRTAVLYPNRLEIFNQNNFLVDSLNLNEAKDVEYPSLTFDELKFSNDSRHLIIGGYSQTPGTRGVIWFYDLKDKKIIFIADPDKKRRSGMVYGGYNPITLSDGLIVATTCMEDTAFYIWDLQKKKVIHKSIKFKEQVDYVNLSPDNNNAIVSLNFGTSLLYNTKSGKTLFLENSGEKQPNKNLFFINDSIFFSIRSGTNKIMIWNTYGQRIDSFLCPKKVLHISYSRGISDPVIVFDDSTVGMLDISSHKTELVKSLSNIEDAFVLDKNEIIAVNKYFSFSLVSKEQKEKKTDFVGLTQKKAACIVSDDDKYLIQIDFFGIVKVWSISSGKIVASFNVDDSLNIIKSTVVSKNNVNESALWNANKSEIEVAIERRGHLLDWMAGNNVIDTMAVEAGGEIWQYHAENSANSFGGEYTLIKVAEYCNNIGDILMSKSNNFVTITLKNGLCQLFSIKSKSLKYSFVDIGLSDYLVLNAAGNFDGTAYARSQLYFSNGKEIIDLSQVKESLWVPDLAERIMNEEPIDAPKATDRDLYDLTPIVEDIGGAGDYRFKITPRRGGVGETLLFINNNETKRYELNQLKKTATGYELMIPKDTINRYLVAGQENPVTVKCYTAKNDIISRGADITVDKAKEKAATPNLYAVVIGINDYKKNNDLHLNYAAEDARDIGSTIESAAKKLLDINDSIEHVFVYNLNTGPDRYQYPDKNNIKQIFVRIAAQATAKDILLVYFAGHGTVSSTNELKKQFYFLTADVSSFTDAAESGISTKELISWIQPQNIKAQKRILIMDACNSGQASNDILNNTNMLAVRSPDASEAKKEIERLNEHTGMYILSSSATNQSAYEFKKYSHGLLTYCLLKVIKDQPQILEEKQYLNVSNWFKATQTLVTDIISREGKTGRQDPQLITNTNFNIGIVNDAIRDKIKLNNEKPRFAGSYFVKNGMHIDPLKLKQAVDRQFTDISSRGVENEIEYNINYDGNDVYSLSGDYKTDGNGITVNFSLLKGGIEIKQFELTGNSDDLDKLTAAIVRASMSKIDK